MGATTDERQTPDNQKPLYCAWSCGPWACGVRRAGAGSGRAGMLGSPTNHSNHPNRYTNLVLDSPAMAYFLLFTFVVSTRSARQRPMPSSLPSFLYPVCSARWGCDHDAYRFPCRCLFRSKFCSSFPTAMRNEALAPLLQRRTCIS